MLLEIKKEITALKITEKTLRNFGISFFLALNILASVFYLKQKDFWVWLTLIGVVFLLSGFFAPSLLIFFYRAWMALAFTLGWIFTRFILIFTFYLIFTPFGLALRIFGKDILDQKIDKNALTYWKKFEPITNKSQYKKQF